MNAQAERRVGTVIGGKWRVDSILGSGSMAAVYAVTHRNGARAALKILHPTLCTDPAVCERFLGEGYLTNSVKHQGIVRVLDDGVTDDGCVFLVMDLLEGSTLEEYRQAKGNRIELLEMLDMSDRLMDVLIAVHTAGIIHRDLKPQNVFVCNDGTLKLLDFGVARVFDRGSQSKLSMFGLVLGTPSFMSPEQALGSRDKVDHRSDIWSLGATIFTALTGETVHLGANIQAKLLAAATVKARSIAMVMPSLPPAIAAAIDTSLRFKKEDRWQTVEAFRRAFREARLQLGMGKPQSIAPPGNFDMSLDEPTHVDNGLPEGGTGANTMLVSEDHPAAGGRTRSSQRPAAPDLDLTMRMGDAPKPQAAPQTAHNGTFIGIGTDPMKLRGVVGHDNSIKDAPRPAPPLSSIPPPPRLPSIAPDANGAGITPGSIPPPVRHPSQHPSQHPASPADRSGSHPSQHPSAPPPAPPGLGKTAPVVRGQAMTLDGPAQKPSTPPRPSLPDGQEGSVPAYQSSLRLADESSEIDVNSLGVRKKGTVAVWFLAFALAAAAVGGIAFFAVKRGPFAGPDPNATGGSTQTTTTPPPPPSLSAPSASVSTPPPGASTTPQPVDTRAASKEADAAVKVVSAPPPPRPTWASGHGPRNPTRPTATTTTTQEPPSPPPTNEPKPVPTVPPDPFGTPE